MFALREACLPVIRKGQLKYNLPEIKREAMEFI